MFSILSKVIPEDVSGSWKLLQVQLCPQMLLSVSEDTLTYVFKNRIDQNSDKIVLLLWTCTPSLIWWSKPVLQILKIN